MSTTQHDIEPLVAGDKLTFEEFERRWEATPDIKRAELIGGVVYIMSPLTWSHGTKDFDLSNWLGIYTAQTPGTQGAHAPTVRMFDDGPQPDVAAIIKPECGGRSHMLGKYVSGAIEFAGEVSHSSSAYDLHQKKDLYHAAGVQEYVTVLLREQEVRWHVWQPAAYGLLTPAADGVVRSQVFPGLWLDPVAFMKGDMKRVLDVLNQGIESREHGEFVAQLAARMGSSR
ncbi:MAG TPA: Uma2 family endonuclease [Planctomycetota bacterium]|nr:Uma2 family endonuclease [Planctomycetota bacterium]